MKHIAFLLPNLSGGGAEFVFLTIARALAEMGYKVDLLLVRAEGELLVAVPDNVNIVPFNKSRVSKCIFPLFQYLYQRHPDVLVSTLTLTNILAIVVGKFFTFNLPVYIRISNIDSKRRLPAFKKIVHRILIFIFYRFADGIIAPSIAVAEDAYAYGFFHPDKIRVIYNPIIKPDLIDENNIQELWFSDAEESIILGVGRLTLQKDLQTLIRAFYLVNQAKPSRLIILGEGELRPELETLIRELGLTEKVILRGFVKNPSEYFEVADVFVLSSLYEGLPNALIQALVSRCPVVSTDCPGGIREILDGDKYGLLVPVGDDGAMADAILSVLGGDVRLADNQWLRKYGLEKVVDEYVNYIFG